MNMKQDVVRKQIDIPKNIIKDLKLIALNADKSVKRYIEDLILNDIKSKRTSRYH